MTKEVNAMDQNNMNSLVNKQILITLEILAYVAITVVLTVVSTLIGFTVAKGIASAIVTVLLIGTGIMLLAELNKKGTEVLNFAAFIAIVAFFGSYFVDLTKTDMLNRLVFATITGGMAIFTNVVMTKQIQKPDAPYGQRLLDSLILVGCHLESEKRRIIEERIDAFTPPLTKKQK